MFVPRATVSCSQLPLRSSLQHFDDVHLHDDLRVEVRAAIEIEVFVGAPSEAVDTRVTASAIRVDGPGERHARCAGNMVERGLRQHLMERHAREVGSGHRAEHPCARLEAGQGGVIDVAEFLPLPPHADNSNILTMERQPGVGILFDRT